MDKLTKFKVICALIMLFFINSLCYYFFSIVSTVFSPLFSDLSITTTAPRQSDANCVAKYLLVLTILSAFWLILLAVLLCSRRHYERSRALQLLVQTTAGLWQWWRFFDTLRIVPYLTRMSLVMSAVTIVVAVAAAALMYLGAPYVDPFRSLSMRRGDPAAYRMGRMERPPGAAMSPEGTPSSSTMLQPTPRDGGYDRQAADRL
ncbi:hypothetical protein F5X99DRAFT_393842, partial [Biscogniauxia marginata]